MIDTFNLSFEADNPLRMLVAREKIDDLQWNLICYIDASKTRDNKVRIGIYIYPSETSECQSREVKSSRPLRTA